ncbi:MAG: DNA polymerase III subunit delta [Bacteroidetes bacterium]|nr:DNA polymerase III subunit delta [Bacteroidota bacterium]
MASDNLAEYHKIIQDMKAGKYAPIYLLHGEEPYFIDQIQEYAEQHALNEMEKAFNLTVLYAQDVEPGQVVDAARRFPMMANRQVIIVKEAQNWRKMDDLEHYFEKPVPSTVLVICHKNKKVNGNLRIAKLAKKHIFFESRKLYEDQELPAWIMQLVTSKGYKISEQNAAMMAEFIGSDLSRVSNELEKILLNKEGDKEITQAEIEKQVGISKEFSIFELISSLASKNARKVFFINHHMSTRKDFSIIPALAMMNTFFSKGIQLKQAGVKDSKSMISYGIYPRQARDYERLLNFYTLADLERIIGILLEYDLKSKGVESSAVGDDELMKEMLFRILEPGV